MRASPSATGEPAARISVDMRTVAQDRRAGFRFGFLDLLRLLPELFQLVERALFQRSAAVAALRGFHRGKAAAELGVRIAQGGFRLDPEVARKVRSDEKQVADFQLQLVGSRLSGANLGFHLPGFFADLLDQPRGIRPVKAAPGRGGAKLGGFKQRRLPTEDAIEPRCRRFPANIRFLFQALDGVPVQQHLLCLDAGVCLLKHGGIPGSCGCFLPEDVGVTTDQLAIEPGDHLVNRELPCLGGHLRIEKHLQQQVAELLAKVRGVLPLNGVQHFVGFFKGVLADRQRRLLAIPRAAVRPAQTGHDGDGLCEQLTCRAGNGARFRVHGITVPDAGKRHCRIAERTVPRSAGSISTPRVEAGSENALSLAAVISLPMLYLSALVAGLLFGSFLNVCIARLPRHASVAWPGSHCPHCAAPIRPWDNIPLVSFVLLRGRCRSCRRPISWRYPLVEAALAALFVLCARRFSGAALPGFALLESCVLCFLLLGLFAMDLETFRLPDAFTLPGLALGLLQALLPGGGLAAQLRLTEHAPFALPRIPALTGSLAGAAGAAATLLLIRWMYRLLRRREGMGLGDVKLAALLGAWLGIAGAALTLVLAVVLAAVVGVAAMAVLRRPAASLRLPFGCFLSAGAALCIFMGEPLLRWYFGFWP